MAQEDTKTFDEVMEKLIDKIVNLLTYYPTDNEETRQVLLHLISIIRAYKYSNNF